jgi:hypothetical protein
LRGIASASLEQEHTNCQPPYSQTPLQFNNQHSQCNFPPHQPHKFLSEHTNAHPGIHAQLKLDIIPKEIIKRNPKDLKDEGRWVYNKIPKGMYGLPQAGILATQLLEKRLAKKGYYQCQHTPGLWQHVWRNIVFCIVVDNFGIKVTNKANMIHLKEALEEHYTVTVNWEGTFFCGIKLTWDYINHHDDTHMPGYIPKAHTKYQHPHPATPHKHIIPPTKPHPSNTAQKFRGWRRITLPHCQRRKSNASKTSWEYSYTIEAHKTPPSLHHSAKLCHAKPTAPRPSRWHTINSLTTSPPIPMRASIFMLVAVIFLAHRQIHKYA